MAMFDKPNMLCSLSNLSIVDKHFSPKLTLWLILSSDSLLHVDVEEFTGESDGELQLNMSGQKY